MREHRLWHGIANHKRGLCREGAHVVWIPTSVCLRTVLRAAMNVTSCCAAVDRRAIDAAAVAAAVGPARWSRQPARPVAMA